MKTAERSSRASISQLRDKHVKVCREKYSVVRQGVSFPSSRSYTADLRSGHENEIVFWMDVDREPDT